MRHSSLLKFAADDDGATAIEYALIVAMIAVAIVSSLNLVGSALVTDLNTVVTGFQQAK